DIQNGAADPAGNHVGQDRPVARWGMLVDAYVQPRPDSIHFGFGEISCRNRQFIATTEFSRLGRRLSTSFFAIAHISKSSREPPRRLQVKMKPRYGVRS